MSEIDWGSFARVWLLELLETVGIFVFHLLMETVGIDNGLPNQRSDLKKPSFP